MDSNESEQQLEKLRLQARLAEERQYIAALLEEHDSPNTTHMRRKTVRKILVFAYNVQLPSNDLTPECKETLTPHAL